MVRLNMALSGEREKVKQVPWFSLAEWHDVYEKIYSNDTAKQIQAYEALLAWKARMPKLPIGVDSTLSILQVCLRDREWTPKIDSGELPMYCENDLSLMYSTTIMRFLNHLSTMYTRYASLFDIAKRLKIPEWIVGLRHNAAHGYELAPLGVLRIAINILLEWLHEEYWIPEALSMEKLYAKEQEGNTWQEDEDADSIQALRNLIELWTSVSLYIHAGYQLVSDLPDVELKGTLQDLRIYVLSEDNRNLEDDADEHTQVDETVTNKTSYNLKAAQALLLFEISAYLSKNLLVVERNDAICKVLCENRIFLSNPDVTQIFLDKEEYKVSLKQKFIPNNMLQFWKDVIILLHKKGLLKALIFKLLSIIHEEHEIKGRKTFAALWINTIVHSFIQLDIAQSVCRIMEHTSDKSGKRLSTKDLSQCVKARVHSEYPDLQNVLWIDMSSTIPCFLFDINFVSKLLLRANEFSMEMIQSLLKYVTPKLHESTTRHLLNLLKIYTSQNCNYKNQNASEKIYTVDDLRAESVDNEAAPEQEYNEKKICVLADQVIRNSNWKSALDSDQWVKCPMGLLPWQNSLERLEPLKAKFSKYSTSVLESQIVAGIVNNKNLRIENRNLDNTLQKKGIKRKLDENVAVTMMNKALDIARKQNDSTCIISADFVTPEIV